MLINEVQQDGSSLEQAAANRDLDVQKAGKLMKNDPNYQSPFPQQLVADAFRLSSSAPISPEPGVVDNVYYVYRFDQRSPPETAMSDEDRSRYRELLIQFKQQRLLDAWIRNRQAEADIRIHKSLENF